MIVEMPPLTMRANGPPYASQIPLSGGAMGLTNNIGVFTGPIRVSRGQDIKERRQRLDGEYDQKRETWLGQGYST